MTEEQLKHFRDARIGNIDNERRGTLHNHHEGDYAALHSHWHIDSAAKKR